MHYPSNAILLLGNIWQQNPPDSMGFVSTHSIYTPGCGELKNVIKTNSNIPMEIYRLDIKAVYTVINMLQLGQYDLDIPNVNQNEYSTDRLFRIRHFYCIHFSLRSI